MNKNKAELVEIVPDRTDSIWSPMVRDETLALLEFLSIDQEGKTTLLNEALRILSRCVSPTAQSTGRDTGLVVGYVQSGKTMSFTTVTTLARDNNFQLIIVIAGVSIPLFEQNSSTRLKKDLRLDTRDDRKWQFFENPSPSDLNRRNILNTLSDWNDPILKKSECQTVLITVMKNHVHLSNLAELLGMLDLRQVPALIIDDEADQAGLNTQVNQGGESTTYQNLTAIRRLVPRHTFLQYTATPQAPLLINMIDVLSPNFADVLSPGAEYVGGKEIFLEHPKLARPIPPEQVPNKRTTMSEPPETLIQAMLLFFVGVAAGHLNDSAKGNRSMMIHPDQGTRIHQMYHNWVLNIKNNWQLILEEGGEDKKELMSLFRKAYDDLRQTVNDLPLFERIFERLPHSIRRTNVIELNTRQQRRTPSVNWKGNYAHILVGGQAMDRGFTVEGLTITYMPRKLGVGNADTLQQRARFLGYKRAYLGYLRIYLESEALDAYKAYISHEEDIRNQLLEFRETRKPLTEWKRAFLLDIKLRPTRRNVLGLPYMQNKFSDSYCELKSAHEADEAISTNRQLVKDLIALVELQPDESFTADTDATRHSLAQNIPLQWLLENFLYQLRIANRSDSQNFTGLFLQLNSYLETHPDELCDLYLMSYRKNTWTPRRRQINASGEIENVFQGANPSEGPDQGKIYPGDRELGDKNKVCVQVFNVTVTEREDKEKADKEILAENVPVVVVWVPKRIGTGWLVQDE